MLDIQTEIILLIAIDLHFFPTFDASNRIRQMTNGN